ncbi:MAG: hypothetical protein E7463_12460 [Ruminococcaceae bacterium]|nr:hypothetical protein [Oscillospiraceae bacterium]
MRDNKPREELPLDAAGLPEAPDSAELDDIRELLGGDELPRTEDFALDDILKEYGAAPTAANVPEEKPAPVPAEEEKAAGTPDSPQIPAAAEIPEAPAPVPVPERLPEPEYEPELPPGMKKSRNAEEELSGTDVRQHISDQVAQVMEEKQAAGPIEVPKSVARDSAVKMTDEFAEPEHEHTRPEKKKAVRREEENIPAPQEKTRYRISDDLRSFKGMLPGDAAAKARSAVGYYRWRCWVTALLSLLTGYITAAPTYGLPLPGFISYVEMPFIYLFILAALQIGAMLTGVSLIADGLRALTRRQCKAETLIAVSCTVNLIYTLQIMVKPEWGGYLPYQTVVILSLFFGLLTRCRRYTALASSFKALSFASGKYTEVKAMMEHDGHIRTVYKLEPEALERRVLDQLLQEDPSERFMRAYAPIALVASLVFALIASIGGEVKISLMWAWSAILAAAAPGGMLLAYVWPVSRVSMRLARNGTALAGAAAPAQLAEAESAILLERDIFPTKMVGMSAVKVFSGFTPEKVNLCTLAVLKASGSNLYNALAASLARVPVNMPAMEGFEFYETGGMGAYVNGDRVLIGSPSFILRSGVRVPEGINVKNGIFVAINMQFAGLYPIKYDVQPSVRRALGFFVRRHVTPVLAVRDFNITPALVEGRFKLQAESLGYPDLGERIVFSSIKDSINDETCAALAVDSTANYADAVCSGKRVHTACRLNLVLGLISAILGMGLNFFLLFMREPSFVTPFYVLVYTFVWFVPSMLVSLGANRR